MKHFIMLCLVLGWILPELKAQEGLEVFKTNSREQYDYKTGDTLCVQLRKQPELLCGPWAYVDRESILIGDSYVKLDSIEWVDISNKRKVPKRWNLVGNFLIASGAGYVILDHANSILLDGEEARVDLGVVRTGAGLVAGGFLVKIIAYLSSPSGKVPIGKEYKINVIDYSSQ